MKAAAAANYIYHLQKGAKEGAPNANQVADRWHLLKNLSQTMQSFALSKTAADQSCERQADRRCLARICALVHRDDKTKGARKAHSTIKSVWNAITKSMNCMLKRWMSPTLRESLGLSRQGVYDYLQMKQPPERTRIHRPGGSQLEPYQDYLIRRWNEGCRNAQLLYREIKEQGYTGSNSAVSRFIAPWRALKGEAGSFKSVEPKPEIMITPDEGKKKRPPTAQKACSLDHV